VLPFLKVQADSGGQASESIGQQALELGHIVPSLVGEPFLWGFLDTLAVKHGTSTQEEVVLLWVDLALRQLQLNVHLEGEKQLMAFEERSASLVVDVELVDLNDHFVTVGVLRVSLALVNRLLEEFLVPIEGELVHGVDHGQVVQDEEEDGGSSAGGSQNFTGVIDSLHVLLGVFELSLDAVRGFLRGRELLDKFLILEQVDALVSKSGQNLILKFQDLLLTLGNSGELLVLLHFELG